MSMHEVPGEFKDEERWLKFFPTRSVLILAVMGTFTIIFAKILSLFKESEKLVNESATSFSNVTMCIFYCLIPK